MKRTLLIGFFMLAGLLLITGDNAIASGVLPGMCREPNSCYTCHHTNQASQAQNCATCHSGFNYDSGCCKTGVYGMAGNMVIGRGFAQYTLLPDNRVLTTGGYSNYAGMMNGLANTFEDTGEIFDPATGVSTLLDSKMSISRVNHSTTLLKNGKVLIVGGSSTRSSTTGELLASAELFDPLTEQFTLTGSMRFARSRHTATLLDDGRVLIAGGGNEVSYSKSRGRWTAELYDPETGTFSMAGFMTAPRQNHSATLLDDGRVLIAGGAMGTATSNLLSSTEFFDPATNRFVKGPDMSGARIYVGSIKLRDGRVLMGPQLEYHVLPAFFGELPLHITHDTEIFDPASETFIQITPPSTSAYMHEVGDYQTFALLDGTVLRADGGDELWEFPVTHIFNPETNSYSYAGSVKYPRWEKNGVMLKDGRPLEMGGYTMLNGFITQIEIYTPSLESQIKGLQNVVSDLSETAFSGGGTKKSISDQLESISGFINKEDYASALTLMNTVIVPAMDGCYSGTTSDDVITDCEAQDKVYYVAQLLATTLDRTIAGNQPPTAVASADVLTGEKPLEVHFTGNASDADGSVAMYTWDFGDYQLGNEQNPTHTYENVGTYTVTLTVADDYGAETSRTLTIVVTENSQTFKVSYKAHIQPIFDSYCHNCHPMGGAAGRKLQTYDQVMEETKNGTIVIPYDPDNSKLVQNLEAGHPFSSYWAPYGAGTIFAEYIRNWIAEGALNN